MMCAGACAVVCGLLLLLLLSEVIGVGLWGVGFDGVVDDLHPGLGWQVAKATVAPVLLSPAFDCCASVLLSRVVTSRAFGFRALCSETRLFGFVSFLPFRSMGLLLKGGNTELESQRFRTRLLLASRSG